MNYRLVATEVGDALKFDSSINEISRKASAILNFPVEPFPHEGITSERAGLVYDWIMTLAKQEMSAEERDRLLFTFCRALSTSPLRTAVIDKILLDAGLSPTLGSQQAIRDLTVRDMHPEVMRHARDLFTQGNYFHAVFEASKAYNKAVKAKAQSDRDGYSLMMAVWGCESGVLKVTPCSSETDRNVQDGIKFLSAGLMQAIRNPTAHEPAVDWPISRQDCLDNLSFISFLFRQLDLAVFVPRVSV